jgi:hypothetical protein
MVKDTVTLTERNLVYTNRTVNYVDWCQEAQRRFKAIGLDRFDEFTLAPKHAYELGYTPDSWAREVQDSIKRSTRIKEFRKFNPNF